MKILSPLPLVSILVSGCVVPVTQELTIGEELTGYVLDAQTKDPVADAKIEYVFIKDYSVYADQTGTFTIEPKKKSKTYWLPPAPIDPPPWTWDNNGYEIKISAEGYETKVFGRVKYRTVATPPEKPGPVEKDEDYFRFEIERRKVEPGASHNGGKPPRES